MKHYDRPIIGVDFDDILFMNSWPFNDSEPNWPVISYLKQQREAGAYLILITCREGADLDWAVAAAKKIGIEFDCVNENIPFMIPHVGDPRKIFCNIFIDDHNLSLAEIEKMQDHQSPAP